jgi:fido (protein-threonine AMPylation protein)
VTQTLIEHGFQAELLSHGSTNKPRDYVVRLLRDQKDALDGVFDFVSQRRELSTSYIKELHAALLRSQTHTDGVDPSGRIIQVPLIRGDWKVQPNSPIRDGEIYAYCPPEQVASEMDRLVAGHEAHRQDDVSTEVAAAWLHHRFTQIHPFQDGNGRVARALASLVLLQAGLFPLVVTRDDKVVYLDALEAADTGNLKPLVALIAKLQRGQFRKAMAISDQILGAGTDLQQVLAGLSRAAEHVGKPQVSLADNVQEHAGTLQIDTISYLSRIEPNILNALQRVTPLAGVSIHRSDSNTDGRFLSQIAENAKNRYGYIPDVSSYRAWISLDMVWRRRARLVFTFHAIGLPGVSLNATLCCAPFLEFHDLDENPLVRETPIPIADELFTFFDTETHQEVLTRFQDWRERVLVTALRELTTNL